VTSGTNGLRRNSSSALAPVPEESSSVQGGKSPQTKVRFMEEKEDSCNSNQGANDLNMLSNVSLAVQSSNASKAPITSSMMPTRKDAEAEKRTSNMAPRRSTAEPSMNKTTTPGVDCDNIENSRSPDGKKKKNLEVTVNVAKLQMKDFLKNQRNGKQSRSNLKRKQLALEQRRKRKQLKEMGIELEEPEKPKPPPRRDAKDILDDAPQAAPLAPELVFKDGKFVVDEKSLVYHQPSKQSELFDMPVAGEASTRITSLTYSKRKSVKRWTEEETRIFYMALRQCGQDFTMIAEFFPTRDRRQISRKYKKEEKEHTELVDRALNPHATLPLEMKAFNSELLEKYNKEEDRLQELGEEPPATLEEAIAQARPASEVELDKLSRSRELVSTKSKEPEEDGKDDEKEKEESKQQEIVVPNSLKEMISKLSKEGAAPEGGAEDLPEEEGMNDDDDEEEEEEDSDDGELEGKHFDEYDIADDYD